MSGRQANLVIPVSTDTDHVAHVLISLSEAEARAVANMDAELAHSYGPFFEVFRDSLITFIEQEG